MGKHRPSDVPEETDGSAQTQVVQAEKKSATEGPDVDQIESKVRIGAKLSAITLLVTQIVSFVQTFLLANFLSPVELGIFAAGTVLTGFLVSVSEGGLRLALVQREDDIEDAADTVFWVTLATGVLLALGAVAVAPLIGSYYTDASDVIASIAALTAGTLVLHSLTNVPDGLMQRQLNFKRRVIVDPARVIGYATVTTTLAAMGWGVWSMVVGQYVSMGIWVVLTWYLAKWRPGIGRPSYKLWREMARFAFPLMIEGLAERIRTIAENALVGRLSNADLGHYRQAQRLSQIPALAVVQIGSYILFPAFSRLAKQPERLKKSFLSAMQLSWLFSIAVAALIFALGEPAVVIVLGEKWRESGIAMVAMAGYGVGIALQAAGSEVIKAAGRPQLLNWTTAISLVCGIGMLAALLPLGLIGVGIAMSVTEMVLGIVIVGLTRVVLPFSVGRLLWMLVPPTIAAGVAAVASWYLETTFVQAESFGRLLGFAVLLGEILLFFVMFLVALAVVAPHLVKRAVGGVMAKLGRGGDTDEDEEDDDEEEDEDVDSGEVLVPRRRPTFDFDQPTMLLPVYSVDDTMEIRLRGARQPQRPMPPMPPRRPRRPQPPPPSLRTAHLETQALPAQSAAAPPTEAMPKQDAPQQPDPRTQAIPQQKAPAPKAGPDEPVPPTGRRSREAPIDARADAPDDSFPPRRPAPETGERPLPRRRPGDEAPRFGPPPRRAGVSGERPVPRRDDDLDDLDPERSGEHPPSRPSGGAPAPGRRRRLDADDEPGLAPRFGSAPRGPDSDEHALPPRRPGSPTVAQPAPQMPPQSGRRRLEPDDSDEHLLPPRRPGSPTVAQPIPPSPQSGRRRWEPEDSDERPLHPGAPTVGQPIQQPPPGRRRLAEPDGEPLGPSRAGPSGERPVRPPAPGENGVPRRPMPSRGPSGERHVPPRGPVSGEHQVPQRRPGAGPAAGPGAGPGAVPPPPGPPGRRRADVSGERELPLRPPRPGTDSGERPLPRRPMPANGDGPARPGPTGERPAGGGRRRLEDADGGHSLPMRAGVPPRRDQDSGEHVLPTRAEGVGRPPRPNGVRPGPEPDSGEHALPNRAEGPGRPPRYGSARYDSDRYGSDEESRRRRVDPDAPDRGLPPRRPGGPPPHERPRRPPVNGPGDPQAPRRAGPPPPSQAPPAPPTVAWRRPQEEASSTELLPTQEPDGTRPARRGEAPPNGGGRRRAPEPPEDRRRARDDEPDQPQAQPRPLPAPPSRPRT
ncbi:oligosaccharide flippase family protein [Actinomycetes bacterium KLBMP 9759]